MEGRGTVAAVASAVLFPACGRALHTPDAARDLLDSEFLGRVTRDLAARRSLRFRLLSFRKLKSFVQLGPVVRTRNGFWFLLQVSLPVTWVCTVPTPPVCIVPTQGVCTVPTLRDAFAR